MLPPFIGSSWVKWPEREPGIHLHIFPKLKMCRTIPLPGLFDFMSYTAINVPSLLREYFIEPTFININLRFMGLNV